VRKAAGRSGRGGHGARGRSVVPVAACGAGDGRGVGLATGPGSPRGLIGGSPDRTGALLAVRWCGCRGVVEPERERGEGAVWRRTGQYWGLGLRLDSATDWTGRHVRPLGHRCRSAARETSSTARSKDFGADRVESLRYLPRAQRQTSRSAARQRVSAARLDGLPRSSSADSHVHHQARPPARNGRPLRMDTIVQGQGHNCPVPSAAAISRLLPGCCQQSCRKASAGS
jgi:hypothetical protein